MPHCLGKLNGRVHYDFWCCAVNPSACCCHFIPQQVTWTGPKKTAPTQQVYEAEKVVLHRKVGKLEQELLEFEISAVYRHKTVQYILVLLSEDQMNDNYVTHPSVCEINL